MSELAQKLIQKEKQEKTGKLDLGNCGLTDIPDEVFELTWLEELSFTNKKMIEGVARNKKQVKGDQNRMAIKILPTDFKKFNNFKNFITVIRRKVPLGVVLV